MKPKKVQLGIMMFLQYAIWGAWAPVLSSYLLNDLGFSGSQVGWIYALLPLATIIAPIVGGQVADRYFASEKVIAFLQLGGGLLLLWAALLGVVKPGEPESAPAVSIDLSTWITMVGPPHTIHIPDESVSHGFCCRWCQT